MTGVQTCALPILTENQLTLCAADDLGAVYGLLDDEAIYELDGYMDFEKYGQDCMENDCVTKTEFGLLRRLDPPFPEQRQGQQMFQ